MAKHLRNGRNKFSPGERFVQLPHRLLDSDGWLSLTPQARTVYLVLERRFNGSNNGRIALSIRDAASSCKIAKDTSMRALSELEEKGFIEIITKGAFDYKLRHTTEYRLTAHKFRDKQATKDFMRWRRPDLKPGPKSGQICPSSGTVALKKPASSP